MVVSVEIGGVLERKLRRLAELGLYASVAEAVREAVRQMLQNIDLRRLALDLYINKGSTLHYAAEFADETFKGFIDYMLGKGVTPSIGGILPEDFRSVDGENLVVDALTTFTMYTSDIASIAGGLKGSVTVAIPRAIEAQVHLLDAWRIRRGFQPVGHVEFVDVRVRDEEPRDMLMTPLEASIIGYAEKEGLALLTDDYRLRLAARSLGVRAYSSISLVTTYIEVNGSPPPRLPEILLSARAIPLLVPASAVEAWGLA